MEFLLYERKFKLIDDELFSFHKRGGTNQIERWYKIKLSLDHGYKKFSFNVEGKNRNFYFHRVVYYAHNNEWNLFDSSMENFIDHIDGTRTNNHISNLRNVTNQENQFNRKKAKGYYFNKAKGKYQAQIQLNGKRIYIGRYDTETKAKEAYLKKKEELHIIENRN